MKIEVRPGEGGDDAGAFADECFQMMLATAKRQGLDPIYVVSTPRISTFRVEDYLKLRELAGTHRVQRIPKGSASRHTSTATIAVLDEASASTI